MKTYELWLNLYILLFTILMWTPFVVRQLPGYLKVTTIEDEDEKLKII